MTERMALGTNNQVGKSASVKGFKRYNQSKSPTGQQITEKVLANAKLFN